MDKREQVARTLVEQFKLEFFDKKELLELVDWYRISDQILALFPEFRPENEANGYDMDGNPIQYGISGGHPENGGVCECKEPMRFTEAQLDEFIELGADLEHNRWASWQKYAHSLCVKNSDGSLTIPKERVGWWEKQIITPYTDLPEKEKEYDRIEVRKYIPIIKQALLKLGGGG